ncbi:hypothetical protein D9M68_209920 [compost metagenome]
MSDDDNFGEPVQSERCQQGVAGARDERLPIHQELHTNPIQATRQEGAGIFEESSDSLCRDLPHFQHGLAGRRQHTCLKPLCIFGDDNGSRQFSITIEYFILTAPCHY